jgi:arginyl-tRNA synthetase
MSVVERVRGSIAEALALLAAGGALGEGAADKLALPGAASWTVERPKRPEHGDLATNVAMVLAKRLGMPPRALAELVQRAIVAQGTVVSSAEIAGPGFLNLRLHPAVFHDALRAILAAGVGWGRRPAASGERVNLEFVSANPTGPINVASGRNAIFGDSVGRLLEARGARVTREYYVNDFGNQIRLFAESVAAVARGEAVPENGYQGEYVRELADFLKRTDPAVLSNPEALSRSAITWMLRGLDGSKTLPGIRRTLASIGVHFDVWFSEESLHRWGAVPAALGQLERDGFLVKKDGAVFFTAKEEGADDKDRVVRKSDGAYTYFASDIAYHADKISRGYDRLITVLGVDHHGYVARVRNALTALGLPSDRYEALLYQLVYIYRNGELMKSSKRAGNFVPVEEVAEEIDEAAGRPGAGSDALRFFFLLRSASSNVDFDIDLAKKKSLDNPVFYVQYGYARLCSIARKAESMGLATASATSGRRAAAHGAALPHGLPGHAWASLTHPDELAIASRLAEYPDVVAGAADAREPHRLAFYVQELAREFQSYFTRLKNDRDPILPPDALRREAGWEARWDHDKTAARLAWIDAIRIVYANALGLLGVSTPERMDRPLEEAEAGDGRV